MFKKLLMAVCLFFVAIAAKAEEGQKVDSKVQKVIVFLKGAQVTRTAPVSINPGTSTLVFENISPDIDTQSIQVHANGAFTILSVKQEMNYLNEQAKQKHLEELMAQKKNILDEITLKNGSFSIYEEEANMLRKNQVINGQNASLDLVKLKQALDFQTDRLTDIKKRQQAINNAVALLNAELQKYNQQIADLGNDSSKATSNIRVTVSSRSALESQFTLSYLVHKAGWFPAYDIRAKDVKSPISISYKANISQQSGEDWKNIKLTLSTGNPSVNNIKPELDPYYLNLRSNLSYSANQLNEVVAVGYSTNKSESEDSVGDKLKIRIRGVSTIPVGVNQIQNQTNVNFNIDDPYSVPSDGKQYTVEINQLNINANYQYAVVPKISTDVFLTAKLTDWNKYNFLPGEANLFFEGTFIGKSMLNTQSTADTLNLSLGADKSIVVTRTCVKELTEKQSLGSNKKETRDWMIEVKNHKDQPVNLLVEDQVPVSQNSSIDVETQQLSGGKVNADTGAISWYFSLNPQDDKKVELKYQVKYPKNQSVIVQ